MPLDVVWVLASLLWTARYILPIKSVLNRVWTRAKQDLSSLNIFFFQALLVEYKTAMIYHLLKMLFRSSNIRISYIQLINTRLFLGLYTVYILALCSALSYKGYRCPKQGQGFKPPSSTPYRNIGEVISSGPWKGIWNSNLLKACPILRSTFFT